MRGDAPRTGGESTPQGVPMSGNGYAVASAQMSSVKLVNVGDAHQATCYNQTVASKKLHQPEQLNSYNILTTATHPIDLPNNQLHKPPMFTTKVPTPDKPRDGNPLQNNSTRVHLATLPQNSLQCLLASASKQHAGHAGVSSYAPEALRPL